MFADIANAMALPVGELQHAALAAIGEYKSRGHGGKYRVMQRQMGSRAMQNRSRYSPHQGLQEVIRRRAVFKLGYPLARHQVAAIAAHVRSEAHRIREEAAMQHAIGNPRVLVEVDEGVPA